MLLSMGFFKKENKNVARTMFESAKNGNLGIHSDGVEAGALSKDGRQLGKKFKHDKNQNRNCWDW